MEATRRQQDEEQAMVSPRKMVTFDTLVYSSSEDTSTGDHVYQEKNKGLHQRMKSAELLNPAHECDSRQSSIMVAVINLVATTCGGGVLSLPLAFRRAGIIPTSLLMIFGLFSNDFALYVLVSCARRTGGRSYGDVAKAAFGNFAQVTTTILLGLLLIGTLTAYLVLVKDLWSPVVLSVLPLEVKEPLLLHGVTSDDDMFSPELKASKHGSGLILLIIAVIGAPLMLKHDLHALRHTSYVGFISCAMLMVAVVYRAYQAVTSEDPSRGQLNWYSTNFSDYAFAFPIVILCYMCSFNILGIHSSLLDPTRERLKLVLDTSMVTCFVLFYLIGLGGYLYALEGTRDNILLNFPMNDGAILLGRLGFCFTLLFGLPLVTLPCREAFRALPAQIHSWRLDDDWEKGVEISEEETSLVFNGAMKERTENDSNDWEAENSNSTTVTYGTVHDEIEVSHASADGSQTESIEDSSSVEQGTLFDLDSAIHFGSTFAVVGLCYTAAVSVPGVGFVWSLAGSSMAIVISFIVPTSCYLKIRQHKPRNARSMCSWVLLVVSCIAAPVCTQQAIASS